MKLLNGILFLENKDLLSYGVSENTIKSGCLRHKEGNPSWRHINDPADNRKVLIDYDSIPSATIYKYFIPSKEVLSRQFTLQSIKALIQVDLSDKEFYLNNPAAHNLAEEYSKIAAWLTFCADQKGKDAKNMGFRSSDELYEVAMKLMNDEGFRTWKVSNLRVFKRRLQPFNQVEKKNILREEALESLICKKFGVENAAKLGDPQKNLLIQLYSDPRKANFEQVYTMYLRVASDKIATKEWSEKALVSLQTVKNYLNDPEVIQLWYLKRHGFQEYRQKFDPIIKRQAPSFANARWVMDGTPWHMYYMEGKNAYARLNIFPILDAYSWCVIGFAVDYSETANQVEKALFGACKRSGVIPYQIQYDHSPANMAYKVQDVVKKITKYNTPTQVGNARAKIIEPFFKHFNDQVLKFFPNYTGSNITAKKLDSHINREDLQALVKAGKIPTRAEAIKQIVDAFKLWNNKDFNGNKSPLQKYRESFETTKDKQRYFSVMMQIEAFWEMPGDMIKVKVMEEGKQRVLQQFKPRLYTFSNSGIRIERKDPVTSEVKRYDFDVENAQFRAKNINRKFAIKYDPETMDMAYLYDGDKPVTDEEGKMIVALEKTVLSMAIADRKEWEAKAFHRLNNLRKEQFQLINKEHESIIQLTKIDGTFTPVTHDNLYPKEVINAIKSAQMEELVNEQETVVIPEKTKPGKRQKATNMSRFSTEETPTIPDVNQDVQPKIPTRWQ